MSRSRKEVEMFSDELVKDMKENLDIDMDEKDVATELEKCQAELKSMIEVVEEIEGAIKEHYPDANEAELKLMTIGELYSYTVEAAETVFKTGRADVALAMTKVCMMISLALDGWKPECMKEGEENE